jgi:cyclopropane-fatty-acyl-phospholipid synthase
MATVAEVIKPLISAFLTTDLPITVECWDKSTLGPPDSPTKLVVRAPMALRRLLWAPNELGLSRAYVAGDLDIQGNIFPALRLRDQVAPSTEHVSMKLGPSGYRELLRAARRLGALGPRPETPPQEARLRGRLHSKQRDSEAVSHHYNVSNDFYRLMLGASMTYSCAYYERKDMELEEAQAAKYELICRKLGLGSGDRLLDVGCGWGGMAIHAAKNHDVSAVGITIATEQAELAEKRIANEGLSDLIEIRLQDYRDVDDGPFDAISSIGMFEHVGLSQLERYFSKLHELLKFGGRLLNHAISRPDPSVRGWGKNSFIKRYVFPDGELQEVGRVTTAMHKARLEVRDVESLREHYARTLRAWVANLEKSWGRAIDLVGAERARIWRLYMAGSALGFEAGRVSVHQVLGVKPHPDGSSGMPPTRASWLGAERAIEYRVL